jgi:phosphoribosylamine--glycine ligase
MQDGKVVTSGGRVLCVTGVGKSIRDAIQTAYRGVDAIHFEGEHHRKDIAWRALNG